MRHAQWPSFNAPPQARPRPRYTLAELLAEAEAAGVYPLPPKEREWVDTAPVGKEWPNED